ncbi:MAG: HD-GYP domain-containing protein [Candidatus Brocadiaceae bacterium]|nr:HD-GYP domain-containing protein [Candidatus Brocadiaceae bacterium]
MIRKYIKNITPGMKLGKIIYGENYEVLLKPGIELTRGYIDRLQRMGFICIYIEDGETADVELKDPISERIRVMATKDILKTYKVTKASISNIEADTTESVIKAINTTKIKKSFQESPEFQQLCKDIGSFLNEIMEQDVLSGLNSIKTVDNYTYEHSVDTAIISLIIAKRLSLEKRKLEQIAIGQFLHDIGKIFIDEKILNKPGKLTPEEYTLIKGHPSFGYELVRDIPTIGPVAAHIPFQHHERQDGYGYPRGLTGTNKLDTGKIVYKEKDKLIMAAEISALADFYDACLSDRPYRPGMLPDLVYDLIRAGAGTQFNKELVDLFMTVIPKYPAGTPIKIRAGTYQGYTGVVLSINPSHLSKPNIKLLADKKNNKISPITIDLSTREQDIELECIR